MKKYWKIAGAIAVFVAVVAFARVTATYAQGPNPPNGSTPPGRSQVQNEASSGQSLMAVDETTMHTAIADALNLDLEAFEAAVAAGKTPVILALEQGIDFSEVQAAMDGVHVEALQRAVANGLLTQEQAGWIASHRGGQGSQGAGLARTPYNASPGGGGQGSFSGNNGDCIYQTP